MHSSIKNYEDIIRLIKSKLEGQKIIKFPYESLPYGAPKKLNTIMVNATGFGGNAVSIILSR